MARERLNEAEQALRASDRSTFYDALGRALHGYLGDKFAMGPAETAAANIKDRFTAFTNGEELAASYIELLEACDMARYAPVEDRPRQQLYEQAAELIRRTEQTARA